MPELPEVETICRMLGSAIKGLYIEEVRVLRRDLRWPVQDDFESRCNGAQILSVSRRGKYIVIKLDNGYIIWHLGMSGVIKLQTDASLCKHDHVLIKLSESFLAYNDTRRFGSIYWTSDPNNHPRLVNLGSEPLEADFTANDLYNALKNKKKNIKDLIMDAAIIVGVGNIYANEALFLSKIHPSTKACDLGFEAVCSLFANIRFVLMKAIDAGGTTFSDYRNLDGKPGYFQQGLMVYGRAGLECKICKGLLLKIPEYSRQTVFCPNCQISS